MAYSYEHNPTNPDAIPLYNDSIFKVWNWFDDNWGCSDWVTWHKANDKKYGRQKANEKFLHYWQDLAFITTTSDCKTWNDNFRSYFRSVGLLDDISNIISNVVGNTQEGISNLSDGVRKFAKIIIPLVIVVAVVFAVIYLSKGMKSANK
jgi:hypothetical protein